MSTTPAAPFGTLFKTSFEFLKAHIQPILVGAVLFGLVSFVTTVMIHSTIEEHMINTMPQMGISTDEFEDAMRRFEEGDEAALEDLANNFDEYAAQFDDMSDDEMEEYATEMAMESAAGFAPMLFLGMLIVILVSFLSSSYYMIIAIKGGESFNELLPKAIGLVPKFIGIGFWSFLRSFIWVPFIGMFLGLYFMPRLLLGPVIMVQENKGVLESARLSLERSKGYWWKIFSDIFVFGIIYMVILMALSIAITPLGLASSYLEEAISALVQQVMLAFYSIFVVHVAKTVMAHPLSVGNPTAPPEAEVVQ